MSIRARAAIGVVAACLALAGCSGGQTVAAAGGTTGTGGGAAPAPDAGPGAAQPAGLSCADIGGVFVAHGTDGRGDCEPADPSPACHDTARVGTDGNYVDALTMTPPFPGGVIDNPEVLQLGISDPECWKIPAGQ